LNTTVHYIPLMLNVLDYHYTEFHMHIEVLLKTSWNGGQWSSGSFHKYMVSSNSYC